MAKTLVKQTINAPANDIWKKLSSLKDIEEILPLIERSIIEGSGVGAKRTCFMKTDDGSEGKIEEEVTSFDNDSKTFSYSITSSPLPVESYLSTVKVTDLGNDSCEVEWSTIFEPKRMSEQDVDKMLSDIYNSALDGLQKLYNN